MEKETRWITYDGVDYYDLKRFDWKFAETDNIGEHFKDWFYFDFVKKEKQVKNGM